MILKYSNLASDYLRNNSEELAGRFNEAITGML